MSKKKEVTQKAEIICILDRSGSMARYESETIDGFNSFIKKQRKLNDNANVTVILFDDQYEILHERVPLAGVPRLTDEHYWARGMTALNDAVCKTIVKFEKRKKVRKAVVKPIVLIATDGMENHSKEYRDRGVVKAMLEKCQKKGWDFYFVGAGIDAYAEASAYGIQRDHTVSVSRSSKGVRESYNLMSEASIQSRTGRSGSTAWKDDDKSDDPGPA